MSWYMRKYIARDRVGWARFLFLLSAKAAQLLSIFWLDEFDEMRSGGAGLSRNRHKTDTGTGK